MKKWVVTILVLACCTASKGQVYITKTGSIAFYASTPLEDIQAKNNGVYAAVDVPNKRIAFTLKMKGFVFPRKLMQEHFNENYAESEKYPNASFKGSFSEDIDTKKDGIYPVLVKGQLNLHGVTRSIEVPATIEIKAGTLTGKAKFIVKPEDYKIKIPTIVIQKIAKEVAVSILINCSITN